jgi:hypothetical protein
MAKGSLRALLEGAIDYAGMFPPASLRLHEAVAEYRARRSESAAWLIGHFVCPAEQLRDLIAAVQDRRFSVSVVVPVAYSAEAYQQNPSIASWPPGVGACHSTISAVASFEFRWQANVVRDLVLARPDDLLTIGSALAAAVNPEANMFFELSRIQSPAHAGAWQHCLAEILRTLATPNAKARAQRPPRGLAGFKFRCGGATPADVPSSSELAQVIRACRDAHVFWKATAGLHHPLRHLDATLGVPVHGFINLFTASVMADLHRLDSEKIQAILDDEDPSDFRFGDDALTWRNRSATCKQITSARRRGLQSFGSCSIEEPVQDLNALGWI